MPAVTGALAAAYADLQARITALASFNPQPVSFTAQLALLTSMSANIQAMIELGIPAPSISLQIALALALVAALEAQLQIILNLQNALGVAGVFAYAYDGSAGGFGATLSSELSGGFPGGGPGDHCNALVLATVTHACWEAMRQVFKTEP